MSILIVGKIPPPVGGVTVHVKRLIESLDRANSINHSFVNLSHKNIFKLIKQIYQNKAIHLHTSNSIVRLCIVITALFLRKIVIFTLHGNLGRFSFLLNTLDIISIKLAHYPILINKESHEKAKKLNNNAQLITAYIPPKEHEELNRNIVDIIIKKKESFDVTFCTSAFNLTYDKQGKEIYQISEIIKVFSLLPDKFLIISDPSGMNAKKLSLTRNKIPENILIIDSYHDFCSVLKYADCYIRFTTTDGDSLSIKEALSLKKNVIASNVVSRPEGVILTDIQPTSLFERIVTFEANELDISVEDGFEKLMLLYKTLQ